MDWSRMPTGHNAASLCSRLSPDNPDTPCISLKAFLEPSDNPYMQPQDEVSSPCKGDPCNNSEVCSVNRNCAPGRPCPPYRCSPGKGDKIFFLTVVCYNKQDYYFGHCPFLGALKI